MPFQDPEEWAARQRAEEKRAEEYRIHTQEAWAASLRAEEEKKAKEDRDRRTWAGNSSAEEDRIRPVWNPGSVPREQQGSSSVSLKWIMIVALAVMFALICACLALAEWAFVTQPH